MNVKKGEGVASHDSKNTGMNILSNLALVRYTEIGGMREREKNLPGGRRTG